MGYDPVRTPWWTVPTADRQQFKAYYITLRVCYDMPASQALRVARKNAEVLGLRGDGFILRLKRALNPDQAGIKPSL